MPPYRLLKHHDYDNTAHRLPTAIQRKALWAQVLLGIRGRTPTVKGVKGYNERWRRTPVQGNHFYLWWIPRSESEEVAGWQSNAASDATTILVHSIRHHDETDEPIDLGIPGDYEEVALTAIDPRFEEQTAVSQHVNRERVALATIKGLPGSGKTISLLYLVKDLAERGDLRKILYITYTQRLKRMAREFFDAQGETFSRRISLRTLNELEADIAGTPLRGEPFAELADFSRFLDTQNPSTLGQWRKYPATFYTELRAHLLGRSFPAGYQLDDRKNSKFASIFTHSPLQNAGLYAKERAIDTQLATLALKLIDRTQGKFFGDQRTAQRALQLVAQDKLPRWLSEIDGLVVDEVQDLTLLQVALLGEIGRARLRKDEYSPLSFIVAGDESQIVQPSGFDWGTTKDLLGEQIGLYPDEFEFEHQRRAPRNLAKLIDATWNLYLLLPKQQRPSAKRQSFIFDDAADSTSDEEVGRILLCPMSDAASASSQWGEMLVELGDKPGRAVVDLSEQLIKALRISTEDSSREIVGEQSDETIFLAREIKGLERSTVIIHGLNDVYLRAKRMIDSSEGQQLPLFEARRIFDEIRVALSRSTDRLVILEAADAPVLKELGIERLDGVFPTTWANLLDLLRNEEMSEVEQVEGLLEEAIDLFDRTRWEQGYRQNRRAFELAVQLNDRALQREAQEQFIRAHLSEAADWLGNNDWAKADQVNQQAQQLSEAYGDPFLLEEVEVQRADIDGSLSYRVQNHLAAASEANRQKQYKRGYGEISAALAILQSNPPQSNPTQSNEDRTLRGQIDEVLFEIAFKWANELINYRSTASTQIAELLSAAASASERRGERVSAETIDLLAERYRQAPPTQSPSAPQIKTVLDLSRRVISAARSPLAHENADRIVRLWLEETFAALGTQVALYVDWTRTAIDLDQVVGFPKLDDHLWELELQAQAFDPASASADEVAAIAHFRAISAAHSGDPAESSRAWEQLGEFTFAAEQARQAGDLERAYNLLRQSKGAIPEDLSTAVKAIRLLQQLEQKQRGLTPAERQTFLEALARLHTIMSESGMSEPGMNEPEKV